MVDVSPRSDELLKRIREIAEMPEIVQKIMAAACEADLRLHVAALETQIKHRDVL